MTSPSLHQGRAENVEREDMDDLGFWKKDNLVLLSSRAFIVLNSGSLFTLMSNAWDHLLESPRYSQNFLVTS